MFYWGWNQHWGLVTGLINAAFLLALIVVAVVLLRRELPRMGRRSRASPALRLLEERYARGEISRDDFLHRRDVLVHGTDAYAPPWPPSAPPTEGPSAAKEPTQPIPPTAEEHPEAASGSIDSPAEPGSIDPPATEDETPQLPPVTP